MASLYEKQNNKNCEQTNVANWNPNKTKPVTVDGHVNCSHITFIFCTNFPFMRI